MSPQPHASAVIDHAHTATADDELELEDELLLLLLLLAHALTLSGIFILLATMLRACCQFEAFVDAAPAGAAAAFVVAVRLKGTAPADFPVDHAGEAVVDILICPIAEL